MQKRKRVPAVKKTNKQTNKQTRTILKVVTDIECPSCFFFLMVNALIKRAVTLVCVCVCKVLLWLKSPTTVPFLRSLPPLLPLLLRCDCC